MKLTFNKNHVWRGVDPDCGCLGIREFEAGKTYEMDELIAVEILAVEGVAYGEEIVEPEANSGDNDEASSYGKKGNKARN